MAALAKQNPQAKNYQFKVCTDCPLCQSTHTETLYNEPFTKGKTAGFVSSYYQSRVPMEKLADGNYHVRECTDCGFAWQAEVLEGAGINALYSEWIEPQESLRKRENPGTTFSAKQANEVALFCFLKHKQPAELKVMDFGTGWGNWPIIAAAMGADAYGAELDSQRRARFTTKGVKPVEDIFNCTEQFDVINSDQVFEHLTEPLPLLKQLVKLLKDDGVLRISVPDGTKTLKKIRQQGMQYQPAKNALHPLEHVLCYQHQHVIALAAQAGLVPISPMQLFKAQLENLRHGSYNISMLVRDMWAQLRSTRIIFQKKSTA